jgi:hypothetical protein
MKKWNVLVAVALCELIGCTQMTASRVDLPSADQLAFSRAEQQCQVVHRHAQLVAKDTVTGRAMFHCVDSH